MVSSPAWLWVGTLRIRVPSTVAPVKRVLRHMLTPASASISLATRFVQSRSTLNHQAAGVSLSLYESGRGSTARRGKSGHYTRRPSPSDDDVNLETIHGTLL